VYKRQIRKRIFISGILAVILVALLTGACYYLVPPETIPYPPPSLTATPQPTSTPTPTPISKPSPTPTPKSTVPPGPVKTPVRVEIVSTEGFSYTDMGGVYPEKVLVLHQGTSGNITLTLYSLENESHTVSLSFYVEGEIMDMEGVKCRFEPLTFDLSPKGRANSTLILEAAPDASSGLYFPIISVYVKGLGEYQEVLGLPILVFPHTPAYIFRIIAETEKSTPSPSPPIGNATPSSFPTPPQPWEPSPHEPEIQIAKGDETDIIFYIHSMVGNPTLTLNLTYQSGALPEGINVYVTQDPLKIVQNLFRDRTLLVTLKVDLDAKEGIYHIVAKGTVDGVTYERAFNLKVIGS